MEKPVAKLIGANGNIFNLLAIATESLRNAGRNDETSKMCEGVFSSKSYEEALQVIMEYVEVE